MADFLIGDSSQFDQNSTEVRSVQHYPIFSPYFQDQWKVNRRLTINYSSASALGHLFRPSRILLPI